LNKKYWIKKSSDFHAGALRDIDGHFYSFSFLRAFGGRTVCELLDGRSILHCIVQHAIHVDGAWIGPGTSRTMVNVVEWLRWVVAQTGHSLDPHLATTGS
jgi:hypothetical protein